MRRSRDALEAFHRALHSSTETERPELIRRELGRLEVLEARIRSRDVAESEKMQHRLAALEHLRERIAGSAET